MIIAFVYFSLRLFFLFSSFFFCSIVYYKRFFFYFFFFFFNDPATPEIYPYGHTLSLHDAPPIFRRAVGRPRRTHLGRRCRRDGRGRHGGGAAARRLPRAARDTAAAATRIPRPPRTGGGGDRLQPRHLAAAVAAPRSEEHTSELQSLMRISYAVFCLQKQNN